MLLSIQPHIFVEPFTPPLPLVYCLVGAGFVVSISFVIVAFFTRNIHDFSNYPRVDLVQWRITNLIINSGTRLFFQTASLLFFILLILTGLLGTPDPLYNLAPTFVWVIWWVGVAYVSAFIGDIWSVINPWKTSFECVEILFRRLNLNKQRTPILQYPKWLGVWPGLLLFLVFAWIENVYTDSVLPSRISQLILIYSGITWVGMFLFGKNIWIRHGEAFSLAFGFLARFAPIGNFAPKSEEGISVENGINLRPFASGLLNIEVVSISQMLFVLLLLATVTFDGFTATLPWANIQNLFQPYLPNITVVTTLGLILTGFIFITLYLCFCGLMSLMSGTKLHFLDSAKAFVYTLIPIALAYHVAHFLMFLLVQGQLIIPLISDPFGFGWNLFGTTDYRLNFRIASPDFYWLTSVIAIVIGHVIAVFLSHSIALRLIPERRYALFSQYPMLVLMVGYTIASLWIITQPMYMVKM